MAIVHTKNTHFCRKKRVLARMMSWLRPITTNLQEIDGGWLLLETGMISLNMGMCKSNTPMFFLEMTISE